MTAQQRQPFSELVLASTSGARRALLDALGVPYRAEPPGVDEHVPDGLKVEDVVTTLAYRKAHAVHVRHPQALVIGSDQLAHVDGEILGKPASRDAARRQLDKLNGRAHEIVTGLCLLGPNVREQYVEVTRLTLYRLGDEEIERYLDTGEWEGCAGGYRVESRGQALFSSIHGDRTNVQGLPMVLLVRLLRHVGWRFF